LKQGGSELPHNRQQFQHDSHAGQVTCLLFASSYL
jgi:hypothetical protein